jgi:hypothetical protein
LLRQIGAGGRARWILSVARRQSSLWLMDNEFMKKVEDKGSRVESEVPGWSSTAGRQNEEVRSRE